MAASFGHILAKTGATVKSRIGSLLGLWATFFAVQIVLVVVLSLGIGFSAASGLTGGNPGALGAGMIAGAIAFYLVYFLLYFAQNGALTAMASPLHQPTFGEAIDAGVRSAPTMLAVTVLWVVAYFAAAIPAGLLIGAVASLGAAAGIIVAVLILPISIYLGCRLSLIGAVVAIERVWNPITAISRTWAMTRGHALTIFLVMIVFVVAAVVLFGAAFYPFYSSIVSSAANGQPPNLAGMGLMFVATIVAGILFVIAFAALFAAIHGELAGNRGEDLDVVFA